MRQSSETLAGRVAYLDIAPINLLEATVAGITVSTLWLRGGFPDSLLAGDDTQSLDWRRDFIHSYLERRLRPWGGNLGRRLVKSPKVYVRDWGLLELETLNDLLGHPVCGLSFEGHCTENLIQAAGSLRVPYFYRTQVGAELTWCWRKAACPRWPSRSNAPWRPACKRALPLRVTTCKLRNATWSTRGRSASPCATARRRLVCRNC